MDARVAAWIAPRSDLEAAFEEVEEHRDMSHEQCLAEAAMLSRTALWFLERLPPKEQLRILWSQEEMEPEFLASWESFVQRGRAR